jgi:protein-S-isoprenylcysteine O-methyltransferase Ste14
MMHVILRVVYACWGLFIATWLLGWLYNLRYAPKTARASTGLQSGGWCSSVLAVVALWLIRRVLPRPVWSALMYWNPTLALVGLAVLVLSTLFTLWARWKLGTMWTSVPTIKEYHELRTDGPYRITRHPIYTGLLGMLLGMMLAAGFGLVLVALVVFSVYLAFKIRAEERLLTETFGDRYRQYRQQVPALFPIPRHS